MFSQNQEEVKLEWMYKGAHSNVDREEYLLGRAVDKTLEHINNEEKQQLGITQSKNHVEHECIPPSIREYKQQCGEQVDISTKLQEDPLIAIKKQEEEKRRQFLNNPVQIKKLQKALKAQKKEKDHASDIHNDLDTKLINKLRSLKSDDGLSKHKKTKKSKDTNLDTILMHKYNQLKSKLTENDLQDIFAGKSDSSSSSSESSSSSSSSSSENEAEAKHSKKRKKHKRSEPKKIEHKSQKRHQSRSSERGDTKRNKEKHDKKVRYSLINQKEKYDRSNEHRNDSYTPKYHYKDRDRKTSSHNVSKYASSSSESQSDSEKPTKKNWGLVRADGTRIATSRSVSDDKTTYVKPQTKPTEIRPRHQISKRLTEEEKEKRRQEMLVNASWREAERSRNLETHRKKLLKENGEQKSYNPKFLQKELLKSADSSTVESRIKANMNNIQRSRSDMNKHFSRR